MSENPFNNPSFGEPSGPSESISRPFDIWWIESEGED